MRWGIRSHINSALPNLRRIVCCGTDWGEPHDMARGSLEYRHLEAFRAIMRSGSVTGAGTLLGVSQPSISRLLAQMEVLVGYPLFARRSGRLHPTEVADQLYEETERIFAGMREIATLCERLQRKEPRRILVASLPVLTLALLPPMMLAWREAGRQESLSIYSRNMGSVLGLVASRQADIGFSIGVPRLPNVRSVPLVRARFYCAMTADHPLACLPEVHPGHLHDVPFIALSREEVSQASIDAVLNAAGSRPREVAECRLVSGAAAMAALGVGVTMADAFSASLFLDKGLVLRPFEPATTIDYRILWAEDVENSRYRTQLVRIAQEEAFRITTEVSRRLAMPAGKGARRAS